jgi:hypothetical protein
MLLFCYIVISHLDGRQVRADLPLSLAVDQRPGAGGASADLHSALHLLHQPARLAGQLPPHAAGRTGHHRQVGPVSHWWKGNIDRSTARPNSHWWKKREATVLSLEESNVAD